MTPKGSELSINALAPALWRVTTAVQLVHPSPPPCLAPSRNIHSSRSPGAKTTFEVLFRALHLPRGVTGLPSCLATIRRAQTHRPIYLNPEQVRGRPLPWPTHVSGKMSNLFCRILPCLRSSPRSTRFFHQVSRRDKRGTLTICPTGSYFAKNISLFNPPPRPRRGTYGSSPGEGAACPSYRRVLKTANHVDEAPPHPPPGLALYLPWVKL